MKRRGMPEARRAFLALQGVTFPRVGAIGRFLHDAIADGERIESPVQVLDITASGKTVTVSFVEEYPKVVYKAFCQSDASFRVYRRGDGLDGSGWYLPHGRKGPPGEVVFCASQEAGASPWRRVR